MSSRASADVPLGMMDGAYFTPRKELLEFFNSHLSMNLLKIEDTASGAVACQLMDYMFPRSIPMKRVNWAAKSEFQYIENYKLLQAAFTKSNVQKEINVDRLIRAKYQDNLEFCQWIKAFFEHVSPPSREDYDPVSRRQIGKGGKNLNDIFLPRKIKRNGVHTTSSSLSSAAAVRSGDSVVSSSSRAARPLSSRSSPANSLASNSVRSSSREVRNSNRNGSSSNRHPRVRHSIMPKQINDSADAELLKKNTELKRRNAEVELTLDNIETERDFYFDKLRGIEVMLQVHEENGEESDPESLILRIYKVLYAKQDDDIIVTDEGELIDNMDEDEMGMDENNNSAITMEDLLD